MAEVLLREQLDTDPVDFIKEQLRHSGETCTPISRFGLSEMLAERTGMEMDEAQAEVDRYCNIAANHIPAYLSREFNLFWPKVLAVVFAVAGLAVFWYGVGLFRAKQPAWIWFMAGTIVFGCGVFHWVRSLERYQARLQEKRRLKRERLRAKYAKPR